MLKLIVTESHQKKNPCVGEMWVLRLLLHVAATQLLWSSSDAATRSTTLLDHHARARSHHSRQWNCLGLSVFVAPWFLCNLTTTYKHLNESELGKKNWPSFWRISQTKPLGLMFDFKMAFLTCLRIAFGSWAQNIAGTPSVGVETARFGTKSCHGWKLPGVNDTVRRLWQYHAISTSQILKKKQFQKRKGLKLCFSCLFLLGLFLTKLRFHLAENVWKIWRGHYDRIHCSWSPIGSHHLLCADSWVSSLCLHGKHQTTYCSSCRMDRGLHL